MRDDLEFDPDQIRTLPSYNLGNWDKLTEQMIDAALRLERGGADFVLMCTNTPHRMAGAVSEAINIPLLHIADPAGEKIRAAGFRKVGLLRTAFTMEQDFYKVRLKDLKYPLCAKLRHHQPAVNYQLLGSYSALNIMFELIDGEFPFGNYEFEQIADRDNSDHLCVFHHGQMTHTLFCHQGHT